jgi:hypothetical protein
LVNLRRARFDVIEQAKLGADDYSWIRPFGNSSMCGMGRNSDSSHTACDVSKVPKAEIAVAAYLDQIAGAARRDGGASLWKSRFAEALDIQLKLRSAGARHPYRNAKIRVEFERTGHRLLYLCFASQMSQGGRKAPISDGIKRVLADGLLGSRD